MTTHEERMKKIDEYFKSGKAKKYFENYFAELESKRKQVSSQEYINWFYDYVSENGYIDDEDALYMDNKEDSANGRLLSSFLDYVGEVAKQQRVLIVSDDENYFNNEEVVVKIRDRFFEVFRIFGQGVLTGTILLKEEPNYSYVKLGE